MNISRFFVRQTRDNGEAFYSLSDDRPDWLYEAVRAAHDGELPNDWRYDVCHSIASAIDEWDIEDPEASITEVVDSLTDVYNADLLAWVAGNLNRMAYVDEAMSSNRCETLAAALMAGQCDAIYQMASIMIEAVAENADES